MSARTTASSAPGRTLPASRCCGTDVPLRTRRSASVRLTRCGRPGSAAGSRTARAGLSAYSGDTRPSSTSATRPRARSCASARSRRGGDTQSGPAGRSWSMRAGTATTTMTGTRRSSPSGPWRMSTGPRGYTSAHRRGQATVSSWRWVAASWLPRPGMQSSALSTPTMRARSTAWAEAGQATASPEAGTAAPPSRARGGST
mmetsp:Transcript_39090/g.121871  ORF Transcript_39090/g.121871 Transcript_39090/m.121871 type:complete len:201 (+) Transcript_39090:77-679(+)